jgi:hypothetical protein
MGLWLLLTGPEPGVLKSTLANLGLEKLIFVSKGLKNIFALYDPYSW